MVDQPEKGSKTEEATSHKIEEARKKGNVPVSREVGHVLSLFALGLISPFVFYIVGMSASDSLAAFIDRPHAFRFETSADVLAVWWLAGGVAAEVMIVPLIALALSGLLASVLQNTPRLVIQRIAPQAARLSLKQGLGRLFGFHSVFEFIKAGAKLAAVIAVLTWLAQHHFRALPGYVELDARDVPRALMDDSVRMFFAVAALMLAVGAADLLWSRFRWRFDLRMTKQEVRDEQRQLEADPKVRARQRAAARSMARRRMTAAVPRATLVVTNPTHYAVALRYVQGETLAPMVVAKGVDHLALRIREIASEYEIAIVEDRALARSLYNLAKTDRQIPPEFYRAVAEIIVSLMSNEQAGRPLATRS